MTTKVKSAKKQAKKALSIRTAILLDRSGSMSGKEKDVIGGINAYIDGQKKDKTKNRLSIHQFDNNFEEFLKATPINKVGEFNNFQPRGSTALLDALGRLIGSVSDDAKENEKVIVVVFTDGQENSSHEFTNEKLKNLVKEKESAGWEFVFLGEGIDSFAAGGQIGIVGANTANFSNYNVALQNLSTKSSNFARGVACSMAYTDEERAEIS